MADTTVFLKPFAPVGERAEARPQQTLSEAARNGLRRTVHNDLLKRADLRHILEARTDSPTTRQRVLATIHELISDQNVPLSASDRDQVATEVINEMFGLGPLQVLMQDSTISDILVNGASSVYVERGGVLERTGVSFRDDAHLMHTIERIVAAVGRRIDESSPMVDARLPDGSRVNAIIPPLSVDGPALSIRRFGSVPLTSEDLLRFRALSPMMLDVLQCAIRSRLNIVISGGTGAGKTTLLNVLSGFISNRERIVTIEDSAELQIKQEHVVRLECRPANLEGRGAVRQRELVVNALRMRPDRILLGEIRGDEALDMLQAMNTGHDGSLTTVHANTPRDAIARIETMTLMGNAALPENAIRAQIASAINLIVQVSRLGDGTRRITHISEITGMSGAVLSMQDLFLFERQGVTLEGRVRGQFRATGVMPHFADRAKLAGFALPVGVTASTMEV